MRKCGCLPNCDTIDYFEKSLEPTNLYALITVFFLHYCEIFLKIFVIFYVKRKAGSPTDAVVKVHVQFPKDVIRRELLFGFNDFLGELSREISQFSFPIVQIRPTNLLTDIFILQMNI